MTLGRLSAERHAQACLMKLSNCRHGDEDMELLLVMYEDDKYKTRTGLREMRAKAITSPEHPADAVKAQLESVELMSAPVSDQPAWVSTVCLHRDHFADCALVVKSPVGEQPEVFAYLCAMQKPYCAGFLQLVPRRRALPAPSSLSPSVASRHLLAPHGHIASMCTGVSTFLALTWLLRLVLL